MMMMFRSLTALLALSLAASLAPAQEKPADESAPVKKADDAKDAKDEKHAEASKPGTTVTLLEAGEAPRRELRYEASGEARFVFSIRSISEQTVMGMRPPATRVPEVRFTIENTTTGGADEADLTLRLEFTHVEVVADPNIPPPALQVAQRNAGLLRGKSAELIASNRGIVRSMSMEGGAVRPGALLMGDIVEAVREGIRSAIVVLPEEPVGVGARWRVESARAIGGIEMTERIEYRLTGVDGDAFKIAVETSRSAKEQQMQVPGSPQRMTLRSFDSNGNGSEAISLHRLFPVESRREEKAEMELAITGAGGTHAMQQTTESWTSIAPAPKRTEESKEDDAPPVRRRQ